TTLDSPCGLRFSRGGRGARRRGPPFREERWASSSRSSTLPHYNTSMAPHAVVLLSGGLDSATALAVAQAHGYFVHALSVDYGQRHRIELDRAAQFAKSRRVIEPRIVSIDLRTIGGSALTDAIDVPKDRSHEQIGTGIPVTYVPARNTILLGLALGFAESVCVFDIFIGANVYDYSGYPDCRPEFLRAF